MSALRKPLGDLLLDEDADFMLGQHEDGLLDLVAFEGAEVVVQSVYHRLSIRLGSMWYNRSVGIDFENLFYRSGLSRFLESTQVIARGVLRRAILDVDGVLGFEKEVIDGVERSRDITFKVDTHSRTITPIVPCFLIDCDNSVNRGVLPESLRPHEVLGDN